MKKIITLLFSVALIVIMLSACGGNTSNTSSATHKVAGYDAYAVKVKSIKANNRYHDFTVTGTTDAPDGSKIYVASPDSSFIEYGENAGESLSDPSDWAKVKNGKFKVSVSAISLYCGKYTAGQKLKGMVIAIKGFDQGVNSTYQFTKSHMKTIKSFASTSTFTVTDEMSDYLNNLSNDNSSDGSDKSDEHMKTIDPGDLSSYNTGITYDQLARTPDQYKKKKVSLTGEVAQALEEDDETIIRLAVNGDYDNIIFATVPNQELHGFRVLENDMVTIYGFSTGIFSYTSTSNKPISLPSVLTASVDDKGKAPEDY